MRRKSHYMQNKQNSDHKLNYHSAFWNQLQWTRVSCYPNPVCWIDPENQWSTQQWWPMTLTLWANGKVWQFDPGVLVVPPSAWSRYSLHDGPWPGSQGHVYVRVAWAGSRQTRQHVFLCWHPSCITVLFLLYLALYVTCIVTILL